MHVGRWQVVEPTAEELSTIKVVGDAFVWAGFTEEHVNTDSAPCVKFLEALGQKPNSELRLIAPMDNSDVDEELEAWKINDFWPNLSTRDMINMALNAI